MTIDVRFTRIPVLFLLFLWSTIAQAADLSDEEVARFVASKEEIKSVQSSDEKFAEFEGDWEQQVHERITEVGAVFQTYVAFMEEYPDIYEKLTSIVQNHGFANPGDWAETADYVFLGLMSLEMAELPAGMEGEIERLVAEMEDSPQFSDTQRERIQAMLEANSALVAKVKAVPEADVEVIRQRRGELQQAFGLANEW